VTEEFNTMAQSYVQVEGAQVGSGTVVKHEGRNTYVLTCEHVVRGEKVVTVVFRDGGRFHRVNARVIAADPDKDLALVRTSKRVATRMPVVIAEEEPEIYTRSYVMGSAAGLYGTAGEVVLCAKDGSNGDTRGRFYQFTGVIVRGMSGGMLCNQDAELIGVPHLLEREEDRTLGNIGFAVPLPAVRTFLKEELP
jgi:serine protease Do